MKKRHMRNTRINVTFDEASYNQIRLLAHKEGISMGELLRRWSTEKLNGELTKDNIDYICRIIREQLRDTLQPSVERLASLAAKGCVMSGSAAILSAEAIARFVSSELQEDVQDTFTRAKKQAARYTQAKNLDGFFAD